MRGPNKIFGSFILQNEPNILFGPLSSENSIITPPLIVDFETHVQNVFPLNQYRLHTYIIQSSSSENTNQIEIIVDTICR